MLPTRIPSTGLVWPEVPPSLLRRGLLDAPRLSQRA